MELIGSHKKRQQLRSGKGKRIHQVLANTQQISIKPTEIKRERILKKRNLHTKSQTSLSNLYFSF